jgi:hypothetical protein
MRKLRGESHAAFSFCGSASVSATGDQPYRPIPNPEKIGTTQNVTF